MKYCLTLAALFLAAFNASANDSACPATMQEAEKLLHSKMPKEAFFTMTSVGNDKSIADLCEMISSETLNCSYKVQNMEFAFNIGPTYGCYSAMGIASFKMAGAVTLSTYDESFILGSTPLMKDMYVALSKKGSLTPEVRWALLEKRRDRWIIGKDSTQEEAEASGNYSKMEVYNYDLSSMRRLNSSREVLYVSGKETDTRYFLRNVKR